jgi:autotransporter-associated beta strand protein
LTFSGTPTEDANTGPTTINSGTVTLTGTGLTSPVVFGAGATGTLNISKGTGVNIGSLSTVDAIDNNAIIINTSTHYILIINQTTDTSFGGIIEDTGTGGNALSIVKSGSSSLTLTNTNTYHGSTSINAGTLVVNGKLSGVSTSTPASLVTVATGAGAALAGTGTINSPVTLTGSAAGSPGAANTGAIISAGDGATTTGKLTLTSTTAGSVNLASGGSTTYDWKINNATGTAGDASGWDELALTATGLTVGAGNFIDVVPINLSATNFTAGANYKWIIATGVGSTSAPSVASQFQLDTTALGTFASSLGGGVSSSNFTLGEDTGDIYIQYSGAPEPTSMMLLGLGVGGVALRRRRLRLRRRASRW